MGGDRQGSDNGPRTVRDRSGGGNHRVKQPGDFPRRLFLAVVGLAPQIVTESLYALIVGRPAPFVPTRMHLITTEEGRSRIEPQLFDPEEGALHALARDYAPELTDVIERAELQVLRDAEGAAT